MDRAGSRQGIERDVLVAFLEEGLALRAMASRLGVSYTTVRHWMRVHELATPRARRLADTAAARATGAEEARGTCPLHGEVTLIRRGHHGLPLPDVPP